MCMLSHEINLLPHLYPLCRRSVFSVLSRSLSFCFTILPLLFHIWCDTTFLHISPYHLYPCHLWPHPYSLSFNSRGWRNLYPFLQFSRLKKSLSSLFIPSPLLAFLHSYSLSFSSFNTCKALGSNGSLSSRYLQLISNFFLSNSLLSA